MLLEAVKAKNYISLVGTVPRGICVCPSSSNSTASKVADSTTLVQKYATKPGVDVARHGHQTQS
jgi:hypothetical protein